MAHYTARTPEDLLAVVPVLLGYVPTDCVVLLPLGVPGAVTVRLDAAEATEATGTLAALPAGTIASRYAMLVYLEDPHAAEQVTSRVLDALAAGVLGAVSAPDLILTEHAGTWRTWTGHQFAGQARTFDRASHPFTLQALFDGRAVHTSREDLLDSLCAPVTDVAAALEGTYTRLEDLLRVGDGAWVARESAWARGRVAEWAQTGEVPPTRDVAWLVTLTQFVEVFAALRDLIATDPPGTHRAALSSVAARTPADLAAPVRCLAALACLHDDDDGIAGAHLELARRSHPGYPPLAAVTDLSLRGPHAWRDLHLEL